MDQEYFIVSTTMLVRTGSSLERSPIDSLLSIDSELCYC